MNDSYFYLLFCICLLVCFGCGQPLHEKYDGLEYKGNVYHANPQNISKYHIEYMYDSDDIVFAFRDKHDPTRFEMQINEKKYRFAFLSGVLVMNGTGLSGVRYRLGGTFGNQNLRRRLEPEKLDTAYHEIAALAVTFHNYHDKIHKSPYSQGSAAIRMFMVLLGIGFSVWGWFSIKHPRKAWQIAEGWKYKQPTEPTSISLNIGITLGGFFLFGGLALMALAFILPF